MVLEFTIPCPTKLGTNTACSVSVMRGNVNVKCRSLGIAAEDMLITRARSGVLKPSYFLLIDRRMKSVVLLVRGTQSVKVRCTHILIRCR